MTTLQHILAILTLLVTVSPTTPRVHGVLTVVVHVESAEIAPLHAEVFLPEGMQASGVTSDGVCRFTGCNAVGTGLTMTETIQLDQPGAFVVTGYASNGSTFATLPYTVTVQTAPFYLPLL